jgi:hypothetical protein
LRILLFVRGIAVTWEVIMQIDVKSLTTKEINKKLNLQMGGWLLESHVWGLPDNNGIQTCHLCGRKYHSGTIVKSTYPICRKNPAIRSLLSKYREFLGQKQFKELQNKLLQLKKEMDEMSKRAYAKASESTEEENKWHSLSHKKS